MPSRPSPSRSSNIANASGWVLGVRLADRFGKGVRTARRDALLAAEMILALINEKQLPEQQMVLPCELII